MTDAVFEVYVFCCITVSIKIIIVVLHDFLLCALYTSNHDNHMHAV